jgi:hypothetical protein
MQTFLKSVHITWISMALKNFNLKDEEKFDEVHCNHISLYMVDSQKSKT